MLKKIFYDNFLGRGKIDTVSFKNTLWHKVQLFFGMAHSTVFKMRTITKNKRRHATSLFMKLRSVKHSLEFTVIWIFSGFWEQTSFYLHGKLASRDRSRNEITRLLRCARFSFISTSEFWLILLSFPVCYWRSVAWRGY